MRNTRPSKSPAPAEKGRFGDANRNIWSEKSEGSFYVENLLPALRRNESQKLLPTMPPRSANLPDKRMDKILIVFAVNRRFYLVFLGKT